MKSKLKSIEQADLSLRGSLADTRKALLTAFIGLLYAQEKVGVMQSILDIRAKNAETIALQYESGRESYGNRLQTDAQLEQSKTDLMQAKLDLLTAQRSLASAIGLDEFVTLVASGTLTVPDAMPGMNIDAAAPSMLSVLSARKSVEQSELSVKQAGASAYPSLTASQSLGWNGVTELPKNRNWQLGLSLSWPIFSNGPTYLANAKASAHSQLLKAEAALRSALFDAKYNLQSAAASLEVGMATVRTSKLLLDAARQRHEEGEIKYLAGTLIYQNWQDIEQSLVSAEQSYLNSLKTVNTSRAQLDNLLNVPLGD
ncbi:MAG: TolC family protein [Elusimicrobia bacterium]|nr:TolC family protein [Elusimicrobiota bacterium]